MDITAILIASLVCFIVSTVCVSTGGASLIVVPVLIWLGMVSKEAVATNMFALIFLSASGAFGFRKQVKLNHYKMIAIFSILTVCASLIGANLVLFIDAEILKKVIAVMIFLIAGSFLLKKDLGIHENNDKISKMRFFIGALLIFILGIYGGFFSGGYVTLLSYVLIATFGLNFLQTAFITKVFNIFSSLAACVIFYHHGLIDFSVGLPLAFSSVLGAFMGTKLAITKGNVWVRNLFIIFVIALGIKLIAF
ncbi:MAG: sulfite exporter TauE/SafE family protein [Candidatus Omnitrophota bacterium]|nr:MAG: sulfite exporter TauE/SafE family protein [Candidatus Omnitrophota bacterium]